MAVPKNQISQKLADLYEENELLWDVSHEHYYNKFQRTVALEKIALELGTSVQDVKKKINSIRTCYSRAKQKALASSQSGSGNDDIAKPKYWLYEQLDRFLAAQVTVGKKRKLNMDNDMDDISVGSDEDICDYADIDGSPDIDQWEEKDGQEAAAIDMSETSINTALKKRKAEAAAKPKTKFRKMQQEEKLENDILLNINKTLKSLASGENAQHEDDSDIAFSQLVLAEYRQITDVAEKHAVKMKILQLLFEARHKTNPQHTAPQTFQVVTPHLSQHQFNQSRIDGDDPQSSSPSPSMRASRTLNIPCPRYPFSGQPNPLPTSSSPTTTPSHPPASDLGPGPILNFHYQILQGN